MKQISSCRRKTACTQGGGCGTMSADRRQRHEQDRKRPGVLESVRAGGSPLGCGGRGRQSAAARRKHDSAGGAGEDGLDGSAGLCRAAAGRGIDFPGRGTASAPPAGARRGAGGAGGAVCRCPWQRGGENLRFCHGAGVWLGRGAHRAALARHGAPLPQQLHRAGRMSGREGTGITN